MIKSYRQLVVWQKGIALIRACYEIASQLPPSERFEISPQLRRAAVSIPANIAEGHARTHRAEFLHFISIARGSLAELETLLVVIEVVRLMDRRSLAEAWQLADDIGRMLRGLDHALRRNIEAPRGRGGFSHAPRPTSHVPGSRLIPRSSAPPPDPPASPAAPG